MWDGIFHPPLEGWFVRIRRLPNREPFSVSQVRHVCRMPDFKVVETGELAAGGKQPFAEATSDVARAASDEQLVHC
jgi:hypothetical protein